MEGNYRLYGWWAGYNHSKLDSDRNAIAGQKDKGWGLGISADQQLSRDDRALRPLRPGTTTRSTWWSGRPPAALNLKGLIPEPRRGRAGPRGGRAHPRQTATAQDDPEWHLELYYRIAVTENLAFSPGPAVRLVNPGGDSDNDPRLRRHDPRRVQFLRLRRWGCDSCQVFVLY
ncbi:MAG: carbohydrate porin [Desulfobacterales bacterium]|nr:carbohydrate porin [Desulfobacterales bacterium]